jgi:hypothetical protein
MPSENVLLELIKTQPALVALILFVLIVLGSVLGIVRYFVQAMQTERREAAAERAASQQQFIDHIRENDTQTREVVERNTSVMGESNVINSRAINVIEAQARLLMESGVLDVDRRNGERRIG